MLRPDTQTLWDLLKQEPALGGFVLIGGTALSRNQPAPAPSAE